MKTSSDDKYKITIYRDPELIHAAFSQKPGHRQGEMLCMTRIMPDIPMVMA